uniref:Uncharacterized protein n=1 Tax=Mesocestoides corti TaxID=53468 RepID=A0A5K3F167_MESCO
MPSFQTRIVSAPLRWLSRHLATKSLQEIPREIRIDLSNGQLPYSKNIKWHAAMNFLPKPRDVPPYHYPIILTSVFIFGMYFAFLREENEYDEMFFKPVTLDESRNHA